MGLKTVSNSMFLCLCFVEIEAWTTIAVNKIRKHATQTRTYLTSRGDTAVPPLIRSLIRIYYYATDSSRLSVEGAQPCAIILGYAHQHDGGSSDWAKL